MPLARLDAMLGRDGGRRRRVWKALVGLIRNLDRHHAVLVASAMAFDAFLSLVPLLAFAGLFLAHLHQTGDVVLKPMLDAVPKPAQRLLLDALSAGAEMSALAPLSLTAFLWVSSGGLSTAMVVFEELFHAAPRPYWQRRLISIACVIAGNVVIAAVAYLTWLLATWSGSLGGRFIAAVVPVATIVAMIAAFLRIAIRGPRPRRRVIPGALVTVVLWALVSVAFSYYVAHLGRYTTLYGGLAAVAIFLFWLWLLALALLVGGDVNAQLEGIRDEPEAPGDSA